MKEMKIGFIGLGSMGFPMARRLVEGGFELYTTVNRNREPGNILQSMGAILKENTHEVILESDIIITILPADQEVEQVLLDHLVLEKLSPGKIVIEMTSGSPEMMKRIADTYHQRGVNVLDAPVSGGTIGAQNGTLTIMVGEDTNILEQVLPILELMGTKILPVGEIGAGKAVKAINQMLAAIHMVASSEAIALAEHLGVRLEALYDVITQSSGNSWMFANKFNSIVEEDYSLGFRLNLMRKDLRIAVNEGKDLSLPLANTALQFYNLASRKDGDIDFSAVSKYFVKRNNKDNEDRHVV